MSKKIPSVRKTLLERLKERVAVVLDKILPLDAPLRHYGVRPVAFAICGILISGGYAAFNVALAAVTRSLWYAALAAYHTVIAVVRGRTVFSHMRTPPDSINDPEHIRAYRNSGIIMLVLNVAMSGAMVSVVTDGADFEYPYWTVAAFALYAAYKISMSVYHVFKTRRGCGVDEDAIREINIIDALVSAFALQSALLSRLYRGGIGASLFNVITGYLVNLISIGLSLFMVLRASKKMQKK